MCVCGGIFEIFFFFCVCVESAIGFLYSICAGSATNLHLRLKKEFLKIFPKVQCFWKFSMEICKICKMNFGIEDFVLEKALEVPGYLFAVMLQTCSISSSNFQSVNYYILEVNSFFKDMVTKVHHSLRLIFLFRYIILCPLALTRRSLTAIAIGNQTLQRKLIFVCFS